MVESIKYVDRFCSAICFVFLKYMSYKHAYAYNGKYDSEAITKKSKIAIYHSLFSSQ